MLLLKCSEYLEKNPCHKNQELGEGYLAKGCQNDLNEILDSCHSREHSTFSAHSPVIQEMEGQLPNAANILILTVSQLIRKKSKLSVPNKATV